MKRHHFKRAAGAFLLALAMVLPLAGCTPGPEYTPLTVTLLKVGKADAIVALSGPHALVLDAGEEDDGPEVVRFLKDHGVREVEAMIITHYDKDHVGGADTVLEELPVGTVYAPDYQGNHPEYLDFLAAAEAASVPVQTLNETVSFKLGDADVLIEPPSSYQVPEGVEEYDNNFSLITTITHGRNRLVFMGDAEKQEIRDWLRRDSAAPCGFLKVPHHGIYNGALDELFSALRPQYSVICDSRKNPAEPKTLELLKQFCPNVFETKDGNVVVISDGNKLELQQKRK